MWKETVDYLTHDLMGLTGRVDSTVNFFVYDTIKIWFLLITIIFVVSYLRTHFNTEYVRVHLQGKSQFYGNILAALFGIITPFCSCSAIPLFLGFIQARIPLGVTFSFLISFCLQDDPKPILSSSHNCHTQSLRLPISMQHRERMLLYSS